MRILKNILGFIRFKKFLVWRRTLVKIICSSIVDDELLAKADAVVNATNPYMIYGSGICGAIFHKAGKEKLEQYCKDNFNQNMVVGEVRITPGFNIPCDVIFAQGPRVYDYKNYEEALRDLLKTYKNILDISLEKGYKSIILPSLGTGVYGFQHEEVALHVIHLLADSKYKNIDIILVNNKEDVCELYNQALRDENEKREFEYYIIGNHTVACRNSYSSYKFLISKSMWVKAEPNLINDYLWGFDPSEPEGSPYRFNNGSISSMIRRITKKEAEENIGQDIIEDNF